MFGNKKPVKQRSKSKGKASRSTNGSVQTRKVSQKIGKKLSSATSKGKATSHISSFKDMTSPKTIDYSKIMEKFGNIIEDNSPRNAESSKEKNHKYVTSRTTKKQSTRDRESIDSHQRPTTSTRKENYDHSNNSRHNLTDFERTDGDIQKSENSQKNNYLSHKSNLNLVNKHNLNFDYSSFRTIDRKGKKKNSPAESSDLKMIDLSAENNTLREENENLRRMLERERARCVRLEKEVYRDNQNIVDVNELENLRNKINYIERENEDLKMIQGELGDKIQEKITLFLKLCRKHTKKIKHLSILFSKLDNTSLQTINESKDNILLELNQSIEKFSKTIHNPAIIQSLLDNIDAKQNSRNRELFEDGNESEEDYFKNEQSLINVVKKLESQIVKLKEEHNKSTAKTNREVQQIEEKNKEILILQKKLEEEKSQRFDLENSLHYIKQLNKDLENKIFLLEDNCKSLKKNVKGLNEKVKDLDLAKNKTTNLGNELRYKDSIISYLETLLNSNNITYSSKEKLIAEKNVKENENSHEEDSYYTSKGGDRKTLTFKQSMEEKEKKFDEMRDFRVSTFKNYDSDYNKGANEDGNNYQEFEEDLRNKTSYNRHGLNIDTRDNEPLEEYAYGDKNHVEKYKYDYEDKEFRFRPSYSSSVEKAQDLVSSKTSNLKNEIDTLDDEIKNLQSKLKGMIEVKHSK